MGWRELRHWLRELQRAQKAEAGRDKTDPYSWDGQENDRWWAEQRRKQEQMRGRGR